MHLNFIYLFFVNILLKKGLSKWYFVSAILAESHRRSTGPKDEFETPTLII